MLWKVERFDAKCARGWVCLPDRTATARLLVYGDGGEPFALDCDFMRDDIKRLGLHETGKCGFFIGPKVMKELHRAPVAAIFEETSRLLLYRHVAEAEFVDSRLLVLAPPAVDARRVMATLSAHHRLPYSHAESLDEETLSYLFKQSHWTSIVLGGALSSRPKAGDRAIASGHYKAVALLSRPETAFMRQVATLAAAVAKGTDEHQISDPDLAEAALALQDLDLRRPKDLEAWLARAPAAGTAKLSNPMVRFYAGASLDDPIASSHVSTALRALGLTSAVGLTERMGELSAAVGALIGVPDLAIPEDPPDPDLQAAAKAASQVPGIAALLTFDRTLHDLVSYALSADEPSLDAAGKILRR